MGNFPSVVKKAFDKLFGLKQMRVRLRTRTSASCRHVETRSLCARKLNTDSEFVVVGHHTSFPRLSCWVWTQRARRQSCTNSTSEKC